MRSRLLNFIYWFSLIVTVLVALPASAKLTNPSTQTIVVFGDSLSAGYGLAQNQGWVALLKARNCTTKNALPSYQRQH